MSIASALKRFRRDRYVERLKQRGLIVGANVFLNDGFFLDPSHCELITIEDDVTFGPGVMVLAHDASCKHRLGVTRVAPVRIHRGAFVGARAVLLPGAIVGEGSIIGAGAVVTGKVPAGEVWAGVPGRRLCSVEEYIQKIAGPNPNPANLIGKGFIR